MQRVNYDEIAPLFDEPSRDRVVDPYLLAFVESHPELAPSTMPILDVECGKGKRLTANRSRFPDMTMVGVDRFTVMFTIAQQRGPSIAWVNSDESVLPLHAESFHHACNQFSYPHIQAKEQMVDEASRGRRVAGREGTSKQI
jgi:ubiquinone/menaquinone biosynthesis C-methylase UbiE